MTVLTAARAAATFPVAGYAAGGAINAVWGLYNVATAQVATDTIKFCIIPAGALVIGGFLRAQDIDSGTGVFDFDVGWTANGGTGSGATAQPQGFLNSGALNGTAVTNYLPDGGILLPFQGLLMSGPIYFDKPTTVQGLCNVAANAGGTGNIWVCVEFIYQNPTTSAQL